MVLTFAAGVVAAALVAVGIVVHRRRARSASSLSARLDPMPAGVKHLAARVGELSDIGLHVSAATRALGGRRRLGVLLGLR